MRETTPQQQSGRGSVDRELIDPAGATPAHARFWWVVSVGLLVGLVLLNLYVALSAAAPRTPYDEIGVLQASRLLSGEGTVTKTLSLGYYPGAGLFLAPIWWFTQDGATVYAAAIHVNILVGLLTVVPLTFLGRRLGLTTPQAVAAASVVMLLPARTAVSDYVLAEQSLALFAAWAMVAAYRLWDRPTVPNVGWFVLATLLAYFTHARALVLVLVAGIWLLLLVRRRWQTALVGLVLLGVGQRLVAWLAGLVVSEVTVDGFGQGTSLLGKLTSLGGIFARVTLVQTWAQLCATLGLVVIGGLVLTRHTWSDLRLRRAVGPDGFVWGLGVAAALLSFVAWSSTTSHVYPDGPRFDSWTYTRYIDPFVTGVVLVGLAAVIRRLDRRTAAVGLGLSLVVVAGTVAWAIRIVPTWGSNYGPANNAGIYPLLRFRDLEPFRLPLFPTFTNDNQIWAWGSLLVVVSLVVILLLASRPRVLFVVLAVGAVALSWYGNPYQTRDAPYRIEQALEKIDTVDGGDTPVSMLIDCPVSSQRNVATNWVGFWFADRDVDLVDATDELTGDEPAVVACNGWTNPTDAPRIAGSDNYGYSLYVLDPTVAERLRERGVELTSQP
ncbi:MULTISPECIES: hypothetical protein [Aeromicrobium]|uniref:Glycosyltransferase RgtA/B/C/D-like domain-containing protein n=1 Tax=Aeromicrobium erythreum TaxID=2041 RepID=A0A0U4CX94_9ACTN|nr:MULTISPECIES: hypothetical protein [Aeromicrobium]ALX05325.1 hypothetical protein AERYTH_11740 [Aeromicrobium erythreum]